MKNSTINLNLSIFATMTVLTAIFTANIDAPLLDPKGMDAHYIASDTLEWIEENERENVKLENDTGLPTHYNNEPIVVSEEITDPSEEGFYDDDMAISHSYEEYMGGNDYKVKTYITTIPDKDFEDEDDRRVTVVVSWVNEDGTEESLDKEWIYSSYHWEERSGYYSK